MRLHITTKQKFNSRFGLAGKVFEHMHIAGYERWVLRGKKIRFFIYLSRFDRTESLSVSKKDFYAWRSYKGPVYVCFMRNIQQAYLVSDLPTEEQLKKEPHLIVIDNDYPREAT